VKLLGIMAAAGLMVTSAALAESPTAESVMASLRSQTTIQAINARTSCATPERLRDPNTIIVCGRRETSKYRYGQRGQPYSSKYKGMTPTQVANAVAGIHPYQPSNGERAYNSFQSLMVADRATRGDPGGLAGILDPLNLGFGTSMKSRDIFWGLQDDVE
jgi:hypothetical protein